VVELVEVQVGVEVQLGVIMITVVRVEEGEGVVEVKGVNVEEEDRVEVVVEGGVVVEEI